jgi:proteasome lid subunit RPN8/RPN11
MLWVRNASSDPFGFAISDADTKAAHLIAEKLGLRVFAVFHSHPNGNPELSEADRRSLAYSDLPWVVVVLDRTTTPNSLKIALYEPKRSSEETSGDR